MDKYFNSKFTHVLLEVGWSSSVQTVVQNHTWFGNQWLGNEVYSCIPSVSSAQKLFFPLCCPFRPCALCMEIHRPWCFINPAPLSPFSNQLVVPWECTLQFYTFSWEKIHFTLSADSFGTFKGCHRVAFSSGLRSFWVFPLSFPTSAFYWEGKQPHARDTEVAHPSSLIETWNKKCEIVSHIIQVTWQAWVFSLR